MATEVKVIQPEDPFSAERVNTGADDGLRGESMMQSDQWVARSALFQRSEFVASMNEGQRKFHDALAPEARNEGLSGWVFSVRMNTCFDPSDSTHLTVLRFGLDKRTRKMQEYRVFLAMLTLGGRILEASRGDMPVDADEAFRSGENETAVNTSACGKHGSVNCYCQDDDHTCDLLRTCVEKKLPVPWQSTCCSGTHSEADYCYCLPDTDSYGELPERVQRSFDIDQWNQKSVAQQKSVDMFRIQPLPERSVPTEEQPKVFLEYIKKKDLVEDEDNVVALRFIFVIPKPLKIDFGEEILRMLLENQKCQKSDQKGLYRLDRTIKTRSDFLESIDRVMYLEHDLHTNPQKNRGGTLNMHKSDSGFSEQIKKLLDFKEENAHLKNMRDAKDGVMKDFTNTIHQDSADYPFDMDNYFVGDLFCPKPCVTENMVDLQYSLLQRNKNGRHALLEKLKLENYKTELLHYEWRNSRKTTAIRTEPTPSHSVATDELVHNPCREEFYSVLNTAMEQYKEDDKEQVEGTVKLWMKGEDGSAFNILRHNQSRRRVAYLDEGRKNETNAQAREQFRKYVHESIVEIRRAARDPKNFHSTKGAIETPLMLAGREENAIYKHPPWSPWHLGIRRQVAPNLGVGDLFIVELFKVIETLFFVSTHMGILLFCWICGGDAFTTRRDKNNFCFVGGPDGGKSHAMNICKQHMLIPSTYMMKTKQSDTAMDDTHTMHTREWCEEQDLRKCVKNPKFTHMQDIEKNRLTAALMYKLVRKQFKDDNDCSRWVTKMVITLFCAQTGSSTNETQLSKFVDAWVSRVPLVYVPKSKRTEGNRSVSAMVSAQAQRSESNKRQESRYDAKCIYYDFLRFAIMVLFNQGVLPGPSRKVFGVIMDKMKDKMKDKFKINTRTELRTYGKAVQFMLVRVIETLFNHPKPDTELVIGFVPVSNTDPWTMKDEKFQRIFIAPDCMETLKKASECEVTLVNSHGNKVDCHGKHTYDTAKYLLNMNEEKLYDKKGIVGFVRTFQRYIRGDLVGEFVGAPRDPDTLPDTCLGEFYRQWTGFNHENFERFVNFINPMMMITMEDTVRAIWLSRCEIWPDRFSLFEKHLVHVAISKLKNPEIRNCNNTKRNKFFYKIQDTDADADTEITVNFNYIDIGTKNEVVQMIKNFDNAFPKGYEVQADFHTISEMLDNMADKKDSIGHKHLGPSFIPAEGGEPYWSHLKLVSGEQPEFGQTSKLTPLGREVDTTHDLCNEERHWHKYDGPLPATNDQELFERRRLLYARYQHAHPEGKETIIHKTKNSDGTVTGKKKVLDTGRVISTDYKNPILLFVGNGRNPRVYYNINAVKEALPATKKWEEDNALMNFFEEHLGYKYDGFKITKEESQRLVALAEGEAEKNKATIHKKVKAERIQKGLPAADEDVDEDETFKEETSCIDEELEDDKERLEALIADEGEQIGKTILLGSPYLGTAKGKKSSFDTEFMHKRVCQPQTSIAVHVYHKETPLRTVSANVPSNDTVELLGLDPNDANPDNRETTISYNDLVNMDRHHKTLKNCPDDTTVDHYRALVEEGSYQFSSADDINRRMHAGVSGTDYQFPKEEGVRYPDNQAMREEFELTMRKIDDIRTVNGETKKGYRWVPFNEKKRSRKRDLPDSMKQYINKRRVRLRGLV